MGGSIQLGERERESQNPTHDRRRPGSFAATVIMGVQERRTSRGSKKNLVFVMWIWLESIAWYQLPAIASLIRLVYISRFTKFSRGSDLQTSKADCKMCASLVRLHDAIFVALPIVCHNICFNLLSYLHVDLLWRIAKLGNKRELFNFFIIDSQTCKTV